MKTSWLCGALLSQVCWFVGCGSQAQPLNPASFLRPERVAFACVRTDKAGEQVPVPLEQCSPCTGHTREHSMFALVTQTTRGEIAAADLSTGRVIDTQSTIPGATFVAVGDAPSAVVVPPLDGRRTYVASFGSSDLRVLDTRSLVDKAFTGRATLAVIPLGFLTDGRWDEAEPVDMVLSPDETRLVIAAPRLHGLIVIEIADLDRVVSGELHAGDAPLAFVALGGLTADATLTTATGSDRYQVSCGLNVPPRPSESVNERVVSASSDEAQPVALTVDAANNRVLVADASLPVIHAVDLATLTETLHAGRPYFVTGTPTLDVVMSPAVPASPGDAAFERYIYAIDAERRDVLVLNDRGVMQSVNTAGNGRPDRIDFAGASILSLEVIEPRYQGCAPVVSLAGPRYLHGVFLAAAGLDGRIRIADVYDLDAPARCESTSADSPAPACSIGAPCAVFQRHRPRIASTFSSPLPCAIPTLSVRNDFVSLPVDNSGETPSLMALAGCSEGKAVAHQQVTTTPAMGTPAVTFACPLVGMPPMNTTFETVACVNADPWAMGAQFEWLAVWEGELPGTQSSGALREVDNGLELQADGFDFCSVGVEGGLKYAVELLILPADRSLVDAYDEQVGFSEKVDCDAFVEPEADGTRPRLAFQVSGATANTLTLDVKPVDVPAAFAADIDDTPTLLARARHCVAGQRFAFTVRSNGRYTVRTRTTFSHRVSREGNECVAPPESSVLRDGQAVPGSLYENDSIAFQIAPLMGDAEPVQGLAFTFGLSTAPSFLTLNAGATAAGTRSTVLSELRYNPIDTRLYAVDSASRGLMPISLSPLPSEVSTRTTFQ